MGRNNVVCKGAEKKGSERTTIELTPKQTHSVYIKQEPSFSRTKRVAPLMKQTRAKRSCVENNSKEATFSGSSRLRFKEPSYEKLYRSSFFKRKIAYGRHVIFNSFEDNNASFIKDLFVFQKWDTLLEEKHIVYPELVKEFYTHFDPLNDDEGVIRTWVKGKVIELNEEDLGRIMGIPSEGVHDFPGNKWSQHEEFHIKDCIKVLLKDNDVDRDTRPNSDELPMETRLLHLILMQTVIGRFGNKSRITYLDIFVMYFMLKKKKVNMARLMIHHMKSAHKTPKFCLPYGMWLTKVFMDKGIDLSDECDYYNAQDPFDIRTLTNSMSYRFDEESAVWVRKEVRTGAPKLKRKQISEDEIEDANDAQEDQGRMLISHGGPQACLLHNLLVEEMLKHLHHDAFDAETMSKLLDKARARLESSNCSHMDDAKGNDTSENPVRSCEDNEDKEDDEIYIDNYQSEGEQRSSSEEPVAAVTNQIGQNFSQNFNWLSENTLEVELMSATPDQYSCKSAASKVKFEGVDIRSDLVSTLQKIWAKHGNVLEGSSVHSKDLIKIALKSVARVVALLQSSSARTLTKPQCDDVSSILKDLKNLKVRVEWLEPFVEKALKFHQNKPMVDALVDLEKNMSKTKEMKIKFAKELANLEQVEKDLQQDKMLVSKKIGIDGCVDLDQSIGDGLVLVI